jgi:hypothetical protein
MCCHCGAVALDYERLPVIPQHEYDWQALLSEWLTMLCRGEWHAGELTMPAVGAKGGD